MTGTADWHYLRKFSLTSSQAHQAFVSAFPAFKDDEAWIAVAEYLYGKDTWRETLNIREDIPSNDEEGSESEDDVQNAAQVDPLNPLTIQAYLSSYIVDEDDEDAVSKMRALSFAKRYVFGDMQEEGEAMPGTDSALPSTFNQDSDAEGIVVESESDARKVINDMNSRVRRSLITILSCQVHETYRKNTATKDLIVWLQRKNAVRNYLLYKANGLRALMAARSLVLTTGPKTVVRMVDALAGVAGTATITSQGGEDNQDNAIVSSPEMAATRAILQKSFLAHQKGKAREYCSLGHRLEIPILKQWMSLCSKDDTESLGYDDPGPPDLSGICIEGAYTAGLAAKKDAIYAKDSIDFVVVVKDPLLNDDLRAWGFEAKGRVTAQSAAAEERHVRSVHNARSLMNPNIRITADEVFDQVSAVAERFQVLQHAFVYDFTTVVLAISDAQSELIRSMVIDFPPDLKDHFATVLENLKDSSLSWAYPSTLTSRPQVIKIPEEIFAIADTIKEINGNETLQGTANLWLAMCKLPKPFPSFVRFIPAVYAFWNSVKGGSDTTTKLMDDCVLRVPKVHLNTETDACNRLLLLLFVLCHRLLQLFTMNETYDYPSLQHFRSAASHRTTFHASLLKFHSVFKTKLENEENSHNNSQMSNKENDEPSRRRNPIRRRIDGAIPEQSSFGATLKTKTPKKMAHLVRTGNASSEIEDMIQGCHGIPMKSHPLTQRKCFQCSKKTSWYCVGCKRWFCFERRNTKDNTKELALYSHLVGGKEMTFQKVCFHIAHNNAWKKERTPLSPCCPVRLP